MKILLTGGAGFIGSHLVDHLLSIPGVSVTCVDNFDDFYSPTIKWSNLEHALKRPEFTLLNLDVSTTNAEELRSKCGDKFDYIIHLAAKAGVRPSISAPVDYYETNVKGTLNLLEFARLCRPRNFVFASSSSVYGDNEVLPWKESDAMLKPISPYASTKLAAEDLGFVYSKLYNIQFTVLRFFTVYGPRQRPDLAIHKFYRLLRQGRDIPIYGDGSTSRDYTYVGDIVKGVVQALPFNRERFAVFNLGSGWPVSLMELVHTLEDCMQVHARMRFEEEQPGDVVQTFADISKAAKEFGYSPTTRLRDGVMRFIAWEKESTRAFKASR
jgi:UDP-glucuronate 4-epimerase